MIDIPGWRAPEASGAPLRSFLRAGSATTPVPWGLGNQPRRSARRDAERLSPPGGAACRGVGRPARWRWSAGASVGWSRARWPGTRPTPVSRVITYGTPVIGGPTSYDRGLVPSAPRRPSGSSRLIEAVRTRRSRFPCSGDLDLYEAGRDRGLAGLHRPALRRTWSTSRSLRPTSGSESTRMSGGSSPSGWRPGRGRAEALRARRVLLP